jgi:hypothetical protein
VATSAYLPTTQSLWLDLPNHSWGWVKVIKLLIVQLRPFSCYVQIFFSKPCSHPQSTVDRFCKQWTVTFHECNMIPTTSWLVCNYRCHNARTTYSTHYSECTLALVSHAASQDKNTIICVKNTTNIHSHVLIIPLNSFTSENWKC